MTSFVTRTPVERCACSCSQSLVGCLLLQVEAVMGVEMWSYKPAVVGSIPTAPTSTVMTSVNPMCHRSTPLRRHLASNLWAR
jgi:hypothetical protein